MTETHLHVERQRMLLEGEEAFARLRGLLDGRAGDADLHGGGASAWNSRDVYAHFARWTGFTIEQVQRKAAGADWLPPIHGSDDEINERWTNQDRALTLDQARDWCLEATATLTRLIRDLSVDQWNRFGRKCMDDLGGEHYRAHIDFITSESE